jgi:hypothetical protein
VPSSASSPPAPNSQARVGVTKYAAAGFAAVSLIEYHRLSPVTVSSTPVIARRRRAVQAATMISSGQMT